MPKKTSEPTSSAMVPASPPGANPLAGELPIFEPTPAELAGYEMVRDLKLGDGQGIRGEFRGWGTPAEIPDQATGEIRTVPRALIFAAGITFQIIAGVKLVQLLSPFQIGDRIAIVRVGNVDIGGGRRMTDYSVGKVKA